MPNSNWLEQDSLKILNETKSQDLDISWSSSDTDEYFSSIPKKRRKPDLTVNSLRRTRITQSRNDADSRDSPVIGQFTSGELSPTFNEDKLDESNKSPVIGKNKRVKDWKKRKKNEKITDGKHVKDILKSHDTRRMDNDQYEISEYSSSSNSQKQYLNNLTQVISNANFIRIKSNSSQIKTEDCVEEVLETITQISNDIFSQCSEKFNIDLLTQSSLCSDSNIIISQYSSSQESCASVDTQTTNHNNLFLITTVSSNSSETSSSAGKALKRKRLKKGGLASQLQKVLQNKESSVSIWKHEAEEKKVTAVEDILYMQINKIRVEFKQSICECTILDGNKSDNNSTKCIVVLNILFNELSSNPQYLKLYKPYSITNIDYLNENVCCYYNICKILFEE